MLAPLESQLPRWLTHNWQVDAGEPSQGCWLGVPSSSPDGPLHEAVGFPHNMVAGFQEIGGRSGQSFMTWAQILTVMG